VPTVRAPGFACNAAGRALRLAGEVRRAPRGDDRDMQLYQAVQALPTVPRLLRWIPASVEGGTRAAAALIAATTYRFYLRELGAAVPRRLRHPLRAALAAAWSRRAYCAAVDAIEDGLRDALDAYAARLEGAALLDHADAAAARAVGALAAPGVAGARRLPVRA
jgi:hypothetical protein